MTNPKTLGEDTPAPVQAADFAPVPEDVATLYSWANLHGAKYRDFSASRARVREAARQRAEAAVVAERAHVEREALSGANPEGMLDASRKPDRKPDPDEDWKRKQGTWAELDRAANREEDPGGELWNPSSVPDPEGDAQHGRVGEQEPKPEPEPEPEAGRNPAAEPPGSAAGFGGQERVSGRDLAALGWPPVEPLRQGSVKASGSRWFALRRVLEDGYGVGGPQGSPRSYPDASPDRGASWSGAGAPDPVRHSVPASVEGWLESSLSGRFRAPVLALFSLAGGVGKTSLAASLGRALAARGERVLLVDTAPFGLLPNFFGARDFSPAQGLPGDRRSRLGEMRTFRPPANSGQEPVRIVALDPDEDGLLEAIARHARQATWVLVDMAASDIRTIQRLLPFSPTVLVPILPDMNAVASVGAIDAWLERARQERQPGNSGNRVRDIGWTEEGGLGGTAAAYFVLNQFEGASPWHREVRGMLVERLGPRLLPFVARRTAAVSEALAEGMTVMDYAPEGPAAEDMGRLAEWTRGLAAQAGIGYRGVRWREQ